MIIQEKEKKEIYYTIIAAFLSTTIGTLPYFFFNEQTIEKYTYDIMIITIFISLSAGIFIISTKTKFTILLKLISSFIFFHFIFFPFLYVYLLNADPNNIKIEKDILKTEILSSYNNIDEIYGKSLFEKQTLINDILNSENIFLKTKIDSIKLNQMFILKKYIAVLNYSYAKKSKHPITFETLHFYDKKGSYITDINVEIDDLKDINSVLRNSLKETKKLQSQKIKEVQEVKSNQFWSYKNVLPYSINIFYTSNLVPKSRISNIIYFVHNTFVFMTLMSLIIGFLQSYISLKTKK